MQRVLFSFFFFRNWSQLRQSSTFYAQRHQLHFSLVHFVVLHVTFHNKVERRVARRRARPVFANIKCNGSSVEPVNPVNPRAKPKGMQPRQMGADSTFVWKLRCFLKVLWCRDSFSQRSFKNEAPKKTNGLIISDVFCDLKVPILVNFHNPSDFF